MLNNSPRLEQLGLQEPRVRALPRSRVDSLLDDVLDVCDLASLRGDPWQEGALEAIASVDAAGQWAATEFGILVSRQQGKGNILLPYELAHLFLWPREDGAPKLIGHTAHEGATAREAFRRARRTILSSPLLRAELVGGGRQTAQGVSGISTGNGNWSIELKNGNRILFFTRTGSAGVGMSFDVLIIDEAQHSPLTILEALLPTTDASPNKQVLFTGTVPKEDQDGTYFEGVRDRGRKGGGLRTGWIEHTPVGSDDPELAAKIDLSDPQVWREANPGLGIRLAWKTVQDDWDRMGQTSPEAFGRQRASIWPNRPVDETPSNSDLDMERWYENEVSTWLSRRTALAVVIGRGGGYSSICGAQRLDDGGILVQHLATNAGTLWLPSRVKELRTELSARLVVLDEKNAATITSDLSRAGVRYLGMHMSEVAAAFDMAIEYVNGGLIFHPPQPELDDALAAAVPRVMNKPQNLKTWDQSDPMVPVSAVQAMTLAVWGLKKSESQQERTSNAAPRVLAAESEDSGDAVDVLTMRF